MDERLNQALRTLRALRQRYQTGSDAGSGRTRSYTVQVGLGYADMLWIAAAIEALETAITTSRKYSEDTLGADSLGRHAASASQSPPPWQSLYRI